MITKVHANVPLAHTVPLGEIADVKLGKMLDKNKHVIGRRLPYLRNINVRWGAIHTNDLLEMHFEDDELTRYGLKTGDVLVCEGGEPGRAAVWNGHLPVTRQWKRRSIVFASRCRTTLSSCLFP